MSSAAANSASVPADAATTPHTDSPSNFCVLPEDRYLHQQHIKDGVLDTCMFLDSVSLSET